MAQNKRMKDKKRRKVRERSDECVDICARPGEAIK
jgi:hypothetical protein